MPALLLQPRFLRALWYAVAFCLVTHGQAQIQVGIGGAPADAFGTIPSVGSWSTKNLPGSATSPEGVFGADANGQLDAFVNGPTNAASTISASLISNTGNPPGNASTATWSSTGFYLQTRPTGNAVTLLMATLTNVSGGIIQGFTVDYAYQQRLPVTGLAQEVDPAHRVYYSVSGAADSWMPLGNFGTTNPPNTDQVISIPVDVLATPWAPNTAIFILFADDNSVPANDWANSIDNFSIGGIVVCNCGTCVGITNQSGNIGVPERGTALFSITATGFPQIIQWRRSDDGGVNWTNIPGATGTNYAIPSVAYPGDNNARFYAYVSNSFCMVTSTVKVLTVIPDTVAPTIVGALGSADLASVTVTFSEAILPSGADPANFILWPTGADPDFDYLLTTGAVLSNPSNVVITTDLRIAGTNYSLRVQEIRDNSSQQNVINPNPTDIQFITQQALLVDFDVNNVWKYVTLSNQVPSIPVGWETVGFDDSTWPEGPAPLGLDPSAGTGAGPGLPQLLINTPTGYSSRSEPTFFRRHFSLASTNGLILNMRHVFEDGAVVYINGVDTYRFNVAAATDVNNPASRSAAAAVDPTPISGPFSLSLSNVHAGDNVIAVAVIQFGATSSDIEMALELTMEIPQYPPPPIVINTQPAASTTVNEGQPFTLGVGVSGAIPITFQWRKAGVAIPGETNPIYHVTAALPSHQGIYSVAVSNSFGGLISANANVTVIADTIAPVIRSAIGSTNQSVVTVTLYDATGINLTQAQTPGNYNIHLTAGGGTLTCTSAVAVVSGTNLVVTLMTDSPRIAGQSYTLTINGVTDTAFAHNPVSPNSAPISSTLVLFPFSHVWRYDQSGADLGTGWKEVAFNDSAWPSGPGVLAFEDTAATLSLFTNIAGGSGANTILSLTNNTGGGVAGTNVTFYFRTTVNLGSIGPCAATFRMRAYIDDGAILYVNGLEQFRYNMTNAAGYTNFANASLTEGTLVVSNLTGFVPGNNVIAVEVHQSALTSADIAWAMQLEALVTGIFVAEPPVLRLSRNATNDTLTLTWTGGACSGVLQQASNLLGAGTAWTDVPGSVIGDWMDLSGTIYGAYTFTPTPGTPRFFRLRQ